MTTEKEIEDKLSILIPMIRKIMPTIIAQDIVGVQPMQDPFAPALVSEDHPRSAKPYWVVLRGNHEYSNITAMVQWCFDTYKADDGTMSWEWETDRERCFRFFNEADRTLFMLKWK